MAIPYDHGKNRLGLRGDASELHLLLAQPLMLGLSKNRVNDAYHALMVIFCFVEQPFITPKLVYCFLKSFNAANGLGAFNSLTTSPAGQSLMLCIGA
jgi:hypothetical protein